MGYAPIQRSVPMDVKGMAGIRISRSLSVLALAAAYPLFCETVSVEPTPVDASQGQTFTVDIDITNVTDLYAYQFDLEFDPSIVSAISVVEGQFLPSGGST